MLMGVAAVELTTPREATAGAVQRAGCAYCMQGYSCGTEAQLRVICSLFECDFQQAPACGSLGNCQQSNGDALISCFQDPE
jgi:hypothetical protein